MDSLFLVSCFSAFFIAVIEQFFYLSWVKALVGLIASTGGCFLIGHLSVQHFILTTIGGSFLGPALALAANRMSTFTRTIQKSTNPPK